MCQSSCYIGFSFALYLEPFTKFTTELPEKMLIISVMRVVLGIRCHPPKSKLLKPVIEFIYNQTEYIFRKLKPNVMNMKDNSKIDMNLLCSIQSEILPFAKVNILFQ